MTAIPKRLPLFAQPANRAGESSIDAQLFNGVVEKDANGELWCYKRPGLVLDVTLAFTGIQFFGLSQFGYVAASSADMICNGVTYAGSFGTILGGDSSGDGTKFYVLSSTGGYLFNGSAWSTSGAPASVLSKPFVPGVVQLDQTFYAMDSAGGVYGSNVNDTSTWASTNLIYANSQPGNAVALSRQLSYLLAFKQYDVEVFYDAANASGSPLASVPAQRVLWGCYSATSIATSQDSLMWLAQSSSGELFISEMKNVTAQRVSTPAIERLILTYAKQTGTTFTGVAIKVMGHRLYLLQIVPTSGTGLTLVFDLDLRVWGTWNLTFQFIPFGVTAGAYTQVCDTSGQIFNFSQSAGTDNTSVQYSWILTTPPFDGGSRNYKYCPRMDILTDNTPAKDLDVRWSDDDQKSWTNWRTVNFASKRPSLTNCGRFRRRTVQFRHNGPQQLRLQAVDMHVEEGTL